MTQRAGIYGRNSKGEAKSIADQLKLGRAAVKAHGWSLAGEYSDGGSASRYAAKARGDWTRLLVDLAAGALDVLVLWESSRGSRETEDWFRLLNLCRERGVSIYVINDDRSYDVRKAKDYRDLGKDGVDSAYETDRLRERVQRGVSLAAQDGGPHGRVAFGYDGRYDPETKRPLRVPNAYAVIVREVFDRLAALTPISVLERDFRERDLPSPSGKPWRRNTIRIVATNHAYIGKRVHGGETYAAQWPAIVDEATFWRVQELLGDPARKTTRPGSAKYLLSYIATAPCGNHVQRKSSNRGRPDNYSCSQDGCVAIALDEADGIVERVILGRLARPDARALLAKDDARAAEARSEASRYKAQLEDARRSFEAVDGISADALARKERALLPLIEDADRRARPAGTGGALAELLEADDPAAAWPELHMAARREVVGALARVVIGPATRRLGPYADPEARLAEAWERISGSSWVGDSATWGELSR